MKVSELIKTDICYFCFETKFIPAKEADLTFDKKYGYARILNQEAYMGDNAGYYLCGIYDYFTDTVVKDIGEIKTHDFIMNQKLCSPPMLRGEYKWIFIGSEPMTTLNLPEDLPHLTGAGSNYKDEDIVRYGRNGIYVGGMGSLYKTEYKNVKHLEGKEIITPLNIIFDLYTELLKQTKIPYTDEELLEKLILMGGQKDWSEYSEARRQSIFRDFKYQFSRPVYRDIPKKYREKSISAVDHLIEFDYGLKVNTNDDLTNCVVSFNLPTHYKYETVILKIIRENIPERVVYEENIDKSITTYNYNIDMSLWEEGFYKLVLLIDGYIKDTARLDIPPR